MSTIKSYPADFLSRRPMWGYCDYPLVDPTVASGPAGTAISFFRASPVHRITDDQRRRHSARGGPFHIDAGELLRVLI